MEAKGSRRPIPINICTRVALPMPLPLRPCRTSSSDRLPTPSACRPCRRTHSPSSKPWPCPQLPIRQVA
ncbi:hypothetical protein BKA80DRAFT_281609 [Phyllosticta citrichinensis]